MPRSVVIVGVGNILCGDDGVGVIAADTLRLSPDLPAGVRVLEAGTIGLDLLSLLEPGERVVLLDAVRRGGSPGSISCLDLSGMGDPEEVPLSAHDLGVRHLLQAARLMGRPLQGVLLGLEPDTLEPALRQLSPAVTRALPELLRRAGEEARHLLAAD